MISIGVCCHSAKLCAHAARDFRSQQNGAVTRMWRSCQVQPSQKERAIGVVRCKKGGMLLQPLRWHCVECVIHHGDVREEQKDVSVARASNNKRDCVVCCCLLPQCEALRTCRSGFPITTGAYFHAFQTNGQIDHTFVGLQKLRQPRAPRSLNLSLLPAQGLPPNRLMRIVRICIAS